jgi:recombination protein RecA
LVRSGAVDVVAIDSVAALVPKAEIEGEMGDSHMGLQARLMSQALRKLTAAISKSRTCVIFINQIRMQIGQLFGNPETTTGGRALKFYSSVRVDIRRIGSIKEGEVVTGSRVRVKVVKNKVAAPFNQAEFDIMYNSGISREGEIIDMATEKEIIKKSGTWLSFGDERLGQGRENARTFLREHPDVGATIAAEIRRLAGIDAAAAVEAAAPEQAPAPPIGAPTLVAKPVAVPGNGAGREGTGSKDSGRAAEKAGERSAERPAGRGSVGRPSGERPAAERAGAGDGRRVGAGAARATVATSRGRS